MAGLNEGHSPEIRQQPPAARHQPVRWRFCGYDDDDDYDDDNGNNDDTDDVMMMTEAMTTPATMTGG